jgi:putative transposase
VSFSEDDCTNQRGLKAVVQSAPDSKYQDSSARISSMLNTCVHQTEVSIATDTPPIAEHGLATLPEQAWERARRRSEIIGPLALAETVGHDTADAAAQALGLSRRQVYVLIRRARQGTGLVTDLAPGQSSGGKGKGRLPESVERIIRELLHKRFLTKQKRSLAAFYREVAQACKAQKLRVPARNTVALRIASLDPLKTVRRREGQDASRELQGVGGVPPTVAELLEQVQIDHTVIDLIVVDARDRQPIGRPYLTLAIDVFTRCMLGMVVTLEAPSAVSVGLCLASVACDKRPWLEGLDVGMEWPMSGKPRLLYLDNAAEFKSEALRRGCKQHGIRLDYRPTALRWHRRTHHRHGDVDDPRRPAGHDLLQSRPTRRVCLRKDGLPDLARAGALAHAGRRHLSRLGAQRPAPAAGRALGGGGGANRCAACGHTAHRVSG